MSKFQEGQSVWIPHSTLEWVGAEIISYPEDSNEITLRIEDGEDIDDDKREVKVKLPQVYPKNPDILEGVNDLSSLSHLHEAAILHNLHYRYNLNQIYTYIGKILISVNPYQMLPLYGREMITAYYGKQLGTLSPHVYALAEDAFKDMRYDGTSQSILVSGESGAGKTQATKYLLQYFAAMGNLIKESSGQNQSSTNSSSTTSNNNNTPTSPNIRKSSTIHNPNSQDKSIEERVLESTPLLEAFGNAKTLRNDNSSRFGKFIEIHFNEYGSIIGAKILTYLLEKSRIVKQVLNERNYHIFYQILTGLDSDQKEKFYLKEVSDYYYLNQSECMEIDGVSDEKTFKETLHAMQVSGINQDEQDNLFRVLSAVLLLGNITFENKQGSEDSSQVVDSEPLAQVAELLGCPQDELEKTFLLRKVVSGKEVLFLGNHKERAENARDSLAMYLYGMLFEWLVMKINSSMSIDQTNSTPGVKSNQKSKSFIGVLDIYGFESFDQNGLNQFCINYANEKLQQLFNQHVFKEEQQEYIKEKIDWSYIDFNDNQDTLDLIEKKPICIITLLDEETMFPKATSQSLANKFISKLSSHSKFEKPRFSNTAFTINHYAGKVTYDTDQFLEKNKDFIIPEQIALLHKSSVPYIKLILSVPLLTMKQPSGGSSSANSGSSSSSSSSMKFTSVVSQFSTSLSGLMKTISQTTPHYIRCIKPNPDKMPEVFNKTDVINQLRCGGIMESVRICTAGFPTRKSIQEFYHRYKILAPKSMQLARSSNSQNLKSNTEKLLGSIDTLSDDKYKLGLTKVFLRAGQLANLEDMRLTTLNHSAIVIQSNWKRYYWEKRYKAIKNACLVIQNVLRNQQAKQEMQHLKRIHSATKIQTAYRRWKAYKLYQNTRQSAIVLQSAIRKSLDREKVAQERMDQDCTTIQCVIRAALAKKELARIYMRIVRIQSLWRQKIARKEYLALRAEARSLKSVQEARDKLEEKLQDIQWRLNVEVKMKQQSEESKHKLEKVLDECKNRNDHLELQLSEYQSKFNSLEQNHQTLQQESIDQKSQIQLLSDQILDEKKINSKSERDIIESKSKIQKLTESLEQKTESESKGLERIQELENEINSMKQFIENKEKEFTHYRLEKDQEIKNHSMELVAVKKTLSEMEDQYNDTLIQKTEFEHEITDLTTDRNRIQELLDQKEKEAHEDNIKSSSVYEEVSIKLEKSKETIAEMEKNYSDQLSKLQKEMADLKLENQLTLEKLTKLNTVSEEQLLKIGILNESLSETHEKLKKSKSRFTTLEDEHKVIMLDYERVKIQKQQLDDERSQLQTQLSSTKMESLQSQSSTSKYKDKIKELKLSMDALNKDIQRSTSDLKEKDEKIHQLNSELSDMKKDLAKSSKELVDMTTQSGLDRIKSDQTVKSLESDKVQMKFQQDQLENQVKSLERSLKDQKEQLTKFEMEIKQLTQIKERFENEFFAVKETSSNNAQESSYLKEITSQMKQTQQRLEVDLEEKKRLLMSVQDDRDSLKQTNSSLELQLEKLNLQYQQKESVVSDQVLQLQNLQIAIKEYSVKVDQLQLELQQVTKLNSDHQSTISQLEDIKTKLTEKYKLLKAKNYVKLETEFQMLKKHTDYVEGLIQDFKSRNQELSESNQLLKTQSVNGQLEVEKLIQEKQQSHQDILNQVQIEKEVLEKSNGDLAVRCQTSEEMVQKLVNSNEQLTKLNKEQEDANQLLTSQLSQMKGHYEKRLKDQENQQKRLSIDLQQTLNDTKQSQSQELDQLKSQLESVGKELQDKIKECQILQNQVSQLTVNYKELVVRTNRYKDLEEIIDYKESEWERLARVAGNTEIQTKLISDYLLSCKLETTTLAALMWTHQLKYWCSFEKKNLSIFRGIIRSTIEFTKIHFEDMDLLSYLLSCCSLVSFVFIGYKQKKKTQEVLANHTILPYVPNINDLDDLLSGLEINSPDEFLDQLDQTIGRTYGLLFRIISSKLSSLIEGSILNENYNNNINKSPTNNGQSPSSIASKMVNPLIQIEHVTSFLFSVISTFQHRMVHFTLSQQLFNQIFCYIGNFIKQSFLLRQSFCTDSFALFVKQKIDYLQKWANEIGDVWVGSIDNAFVHVREIISIILLRDKEKLVEEKVRKQLCPNLNINQLKFILAMYHSEFGKVNIKIINNICPPNKSSNNSPINHGSNNDQSFKQLIDENKLHPIPFKSLHYLEIDDIKNLSIPISIRYQIESEIKNISLKLIK
ncbi:myosin-5b [Tieghemostelium lacteum]|uniref:Myosin-5b n=1 Tax=Tieghemostelium lacteum TaxID=361077 RepID=A0A151ZBB8_TIELA|nr:myosin-5b [Tieghemostelium lacteum]|eukprot:KYQ91225.1 myosin-5b [Tieghemostelium lacteum]